MAEHDAASSDEEDNRQDSDDDVEAAADATKRERDLMHRNMLNNFTPAQLERYEAFRRSRLDKKNMKKLQQTIIGHQVNVNMVTVMCGIGKVFVGELIETARVVAQEQGSHCALQVHHIQEAYQRLDRRGNIPHLHGNSSPLQAI